MLSQKLSPIDCTNIIPHKKIVAKWLYKYHFS